MPRQRTLPVQTIFEEIRALAEHTPVLAASPGSVKVTIGRVNEQGEPVPEVPMEYVTIEGDMYEALIGDGAGWAAPGKPPGTYRNDDLWYFIDIIRSDRGG